VGGVYLRPFISICNVSRPNVAIRLKRYGVLANLFVSAAGSNICTLTVYVSKVIVSLREELAEFFISKSFFKLYKLLKV